MANWLYNLLHGKLPGKGFLGRSSTGSGPGELLDPAAARALLDSSGRDFSTVAEAELEEYTEPEHCYVKETSLIYQYDSTSTATRDAVLVLNTGGTGRLIAIGGVVYDPVTRKIFLGANIELTENIKIPNTTNADQSGIVYKGTTPFIHNFNYGNNGTVTTEGENIFIGEYAGNFTMGSTATSTYESSYNTAVGAQTLYYNTKGYANTAVGSLALQKNTEGSSNMAIGGNALKENTTGYSNAAIGVDALKLNTLGASNSGIGREALSSNTTGYYNVAVGREAGKYITGGSTANETSNTSVYLGGKTKASADGNSNEIVIGYDAVGNGSNTVTLGNTNITNVRTSGSLTLGAITVPNTDGAADQVLKTDGSGTLTWRSIASPALTITADITLTAATRAFLIFNFAGTGGVVTFPASPEDGQEFHPENIGSFLVTIARNGKKINGAESNVTIDPQSNGFFKYDNASGGWWNFG